MKPINTKVIGVIGGTGTGKTHLADFIVKRLDGEFVEGDLIGHQALMKPEIIQAIKARFGSKVFTPEGVVDRKALGQIVFSDKASLKDLNAIMHPKMYRMIERQVSESEKPFVILEAAVMIEAGFNKLVDIMITLVADDQVRLERLVDKRHIDRERALKMMASGRDDYRDYGDYIIDTSMGSEIIEDELFRICDRIKETVNE